MIQSDWLAQQFEQNRSHLRAVAYRMLGSLPDADDAVQEAWLRLSRTDSAAIENLGGWLTTVVARISLDMLRSRASRREDSLVPQAPDSPAPIEPKSAAADPEAEALLADSVGLALLVVLDRLDPAERLAFVLHDMFAAPFDEISAIVGRTPGATRQLASRARRRVQGAEAPDRANQLQQRKIVDAFSSALRAGDFEALVAVLDPGLVVHADAASAAGGAAREIHGAEVWARSALVYSRGARFLQPVLINGELGVILAPRGRMSRAITFTFTFGKIAQINVIGDAKHLRSLDLAALPD
ncbi:MAG TPA: sigma-70 family RNA polymerase sigma factor [Candidatus Acidoferrales bacterium]|nr:sigma-70 family RNA polymerase sigma factor [Candidatus Acidoferrales bacterium]